MISVFSQPARKGLILLGCYPLEPMDPHLLLLVKKKFTIVPHLIRVRGVRVSMRSIVVGTIRGRGVKVSARSIVVRTN